jgi:hypothetical protein
MMNRLTRLSILMMLIGLLALLNSGLDRAIGAQRANRATAPEAGSTSYRLDWAAVGEVSGGTSASTRYRLSATIGQMGAGTQSSSPHYALCAGFQCAGGAGLYRVYLPLVLK